VSCVRRSLSSAVLIDPLASGSTGLDCRRIPSLHAVVVPSLREGDGGSAVGAAGTLKAGGGAATVATGTVGANALGAKSCSGTKNGFGFIEAMARNTWSKHRAA
jgi:hypothetical protein